MLLLTAWVRVVVACAKIGPDELVQVGTQMSMPRAWKKWYHLWTRLWTKVIAGYNGSLIQGQLICHRIVISLVSLGVVGRWHFSELLVFEWLAFLSSSTSFSHLKESGHSSSSSKSEASSELVLVLSSDEASSWISPYVMCRCSNLS